MVESNKTSVKRCAGHTGASLEKGPDTGKVCAPEGGQRPSVHGIRKEGRWPEVRAWVRQ